MPSTAVGVRHVADLAAALERFDPCLGVLERWGSELACRLRNGARLLTAGNGGSAAQAQHLTAELVGRYREERPPYSGICLSAETSTLTAIANDYAPEELYARQVEAHARSGDVLILLSTSGRSPNVVAAAKRGHTLGARVWAMCGPGPNPLADAADESIFVQSPHTATVQELHLVALHILCAAFDQAMTEQADLEPAMS